MPRTRTGPRWTHPSLDAEHVDDQGRATTGHDAITPGDCSTDFRAANTPGGENPWCDGCGSPGGCLC